MLKLLKHITAPILVTAPILAITVMCAIAPMASADEWGEPMSAQFSDGWITPYFGKEGKWSVEVRKSVDGERYLITDPYHQPGFTALFPDGTPNTDEPHDIIIDSSDPMYVTMELTELFTFKPGHYAGNAPQTIWAQTRATYLEAASGYDRYTLIDAGLNSTFTDGMITLSSCAVGFSADQYQCGSTLATDGRFHNTVITFATTGITSTTVGNATATPEYFTLTGQPVAHPLPGSLLLMRQGNNVAKTIIR